MSKRWSFYLFFSFVAIGLGRRAEGAEWRDLLHLNGDRLTIEDPRFYPSQKEVKTDDGITVANEELQHALTAFKNEDLNYICSFPARVFWLQNQFKLKEDFSIEANCSELKTFVTKAPMDELFYVFASENISKPTSIMGHSYLKLRGNHETGFPVEHAITFFTEAEGLNYPLLLWETMVVGKRGYYALVPSQTLDLNYLFVEGRSIWDQKIKLNNFQRRLLQLHIFELKNVEFTYYFHKYNCSTLDRNILAVVYPELKNSFSLWVTPQDVLKGLASLGAVEDFQIRASSQWRLRALEASLNLTLDQIEGVRSGHFEELRFEALNIKEQFMALELARAFNDYQFERDEISLKTWSSNNSRFDLQKKEYFSDFQLDAKNFKSPLESQQDSIFYLGAFNEGGPHFSFGLLPASKDLLGSSKSYFNEFELSLGKVLFEFSNSLKLRQLTVISAKSLQPSSVFLPSLSGLFNIGFDSKMLITGFRKSIWNLEVGLGKTKTFHKSIDVYSLASLGYEEYSDGAFMRLQLGCIVRLVKGIKLHSNYSRRLMRLSRFQDNFELYNSVSYNAQSFGFDLEVRNSSINKFNDSYFGMNLRTYF